MEEHEKPFADQLSIETPEQVDLKLPIASVGSRLLALLADTLLQGAATLLVFLLLFLVALSAPRQHGAASPGGEQWVIAGFILLQFLFVWGYFSLFEAFWHGQTPGKRMLRIRVMQVSGRPISLFESMTRNLVRVIDMLPSIYLVGLVAMLCNRRAQRLGDLAAGTLVVHESALPRGSKAAPGARLITPHTQPPAASPAPAHSLLPASALARLAPADTQVLEQFFARNLELEPSVRAAMAQAIAAQLSAKMDWQTPDAVARPEAMLETIYIALAGSGPRRW